MQVQPRIPDRSRFIGEVQTSDPEGICVIYWMLRDYRAVDNWALVQAQNLARTYQVPLRVCATLPMMPHDKNLRMRTFQLEGLRETANHLRELHIPFHLLHTDPRSALRDLCAKHAPRVVVCDFYPLRVPTGTVESVAADLSQRPTPVALLQVDAHNVVPCWCVQFASGARVFRSRIKPLRRKFLVDIPPIQANDAPRLSEKMCEAAETANDWDAALQAVDVCDVKPVAWARGGTRHGLEMLEGFIENRLTRFADKRNKPCAEALSGLSPWLHHGHISAQAVIRRVQSAKHVGSANVESFVEECLVRSELADNFCFHTPDHYDDLRGAAAWARKTLQDHASDTRDPQYTLQELESHTTADSLWNAAQRQLVEQGKMHGFMRMYWAKKILEWSPSPELALQWSNHLNDKYSLDGRDPNGYVGCAWSVMGTHDQGWAERDIFGKIRYMNYNGCRRKFDVDAYIEKGWKLHF